MYHMATRTLNRLHVRNIVMHFQVSVIVCEIKDVFSALKFASRNAVAEKCFVYTRLTSFTIRYLIFKHLELISYYKKGKEINGHYAAPPHYSSK